MQEPRPHERQCAPESPSDGHGDLEPATGTQPAELAHPMALDQEDLQLTEQVRLVEIDSIWDEIEDLGVVESEDLETQGLRAYVHRMMRVLSLPARLAICTSLAYILVFNLSVVRGSSMAPGIHDGDRIVVDEFSYLFTDIDRGDIVVLRYPLDPNLDYIKRVVGLPGDMITMSGGKVWINGEQLEERYTLERDPYTRLVEVVKEGHYFVLGDNRLHSSDSREFGQVEAGLVRGKVDLRLWPFERIGLLD